MARSISGLHEDLRVVLRTMRRSPGFVVIAVVILALGSAITGVVFSTVNGWLAVGRVIPNGDRLLVVAPTQNGTANPTGYFREAAYRRLFDYDFDTVTDLFASRPLPVTLAIDERGTSVRAEAVAGSYFEALDVPPLLGRPLGAADGQGGAATAVVLSEAAWRRLFDGDPYVVGKAVRLSGMHAQVVGVMPARVRGLSIPTSTTADLWVAIESVRGLVAPRGEVVWAQVFGRLRDGATLDRAQAELAARLTAFDADQPGVSATARPIAEGVLPARARFAMRTVGVGLIALSTLVLMIACANLANLLLARGASRASEMAVRMALGASPVRLLRLQLVETLAVTTMGGLLGLGLVTWIGRAADRFTFQLDRGGLGSGSVLVDGWVIGYFGLLIAGTSIAVAILPALRAIRLDPGQLFAAGAVRATMTGRFEMKRTWLVASQVAGSTVLLVVAALFVRSASYASEYHVAFDASRVMIGSLDFGAEASDPDRSVQRQDAVRLTLASEPAVRAAAVSTGLPASGGGELVAIASEDSDRRAHSGVPCRLLVVSPGFFDVLGLDIRSGRDFTATDTAGSRGVVILNETAAATLWKDREPLGRRLRIRSGSPIEVVGLVRDTDLTTREAPDRCYVYLPHTQRPATRVMLAVTPAGDVSGGAGTVLSSLPDSFPGLSVVSPGSARDYLNRSGGRSRAVAAGLTLLGALALLIASTGLYGVMSYLVGLRRGEFGIRRVLGATNGQIYRLVITEAMRMTGLGILAGLPLAYVVSLWVEKALIGVTAADALTFMAVPAVLVAVGVLAAWLPAVRASRVQPATALRQL